MSDIIHRGLIDCVRCGRAPQQLFKHNRTGQHFCKSCLQGEYKKTKAVRLVAVKDEKK